jgi:hypothetical protein
MPKRIGNTTANYGIFCAFGKPRRLFKKDRFTFEFALLTNLFCAVEPKHVQIRRRLFTVFRKFRKRALANKTYSHNLAPPFQYTEETHKKFPFHIV